MLIKSDAVKEQELIEEFISEDHDLRRQYDLFRDEMDFKQLLIDTRKSHHCTQKEISERSGLSQQAISRLEKESGGTLDTVFRYLHALGLTLSVKEI